MGGGRVIGDLWWLFKDRRLTIRSMLPKLWRWEEDPSDWTVNLFALPWIRDERWDYIEFVVLESSRISGKRRFSFKWCANQGSLL